MAPTACFLLQYKFRAGADVGGGGADEDFECARFGNPVFAENIVEGEGARVEGEARGLGLSGLEVQLLEAFQLFERADQGGLHVAHVELDDFFPGQAAGVGHVDADFKGLAEFDLAGRVQVGVGKGGVG